MKDKKIIEKNIDELIKSIEDYENELSNIQPKFSQESLNELANQFDDIHPHLTKLDEVKTALSTLAMFIDFFDKWRLIMKLVNAHINEMERRLRKEYD